MADGLPEGLVTHSQGITGEIDRVDRVEPEDIAQLWKGTYPHHLRASKHITRPMLMQIASSLFHQQGCDCGWRWSTAGEFLLEDLEQQETAASN